MNLSFSVSCCLLLLSTYWVSSLCGIIEFQDKELFSDETIRIKLGIVTVNDSFIGEKQPYFEIDHTFTQLRPTRASGIIQAVVYHTSQADNIGLVEDGSRYYCCTSDLIAKELCSEEGSVIVRDQTIYSAEILLHGLPFPYTAKIDGFTRSGVYYLKYFNCLSGNAGDVLINGNVIWMNPFGQLSAELYPLLWFFGFLTVCYIALGLIWLALSAFYWQDLLMLQNWISTVIFLGMVECVTWYFDFLSFNSNGHFNFGSIFVGVLSSTLKRTVSRLLVLVVCLGYGVVKANLGSDTSRVLLLGFVYFIASGIQQLILTYLREFDNDFLQLVGTIFIVPTATLDMLFYYWIFQSITQTIRHLATRKQEVKLQMYENLYWILILSGVLTVIIVLYETILIYNGTEDLMWNKWWEFQAFWHLLYFFILLAIAYLWRPTSNNTRYAYVKHEDDEDEEEMDNTHRRAARDSNETKATKNDSNEVGSKEI